MKNIVCMIWFILDFGAMKMENNIRSAAFVNKTLNSGKGRDIFFTMVTLRRDRGWDNVIKTKEVGFYR